MTIADSASALVARGIAAGTRLGHFTIVFRDDLGVPAVVDHETNTIWLDPNEPLEDAIFVLLACFDKLVGGTVVKTEDGHLGVAVGAEGMPVPPPSPRPRPRLRLV